MSILIVDDDAGVQEFLGDVLSANGYDVEHARGGREALARLRGGPRPSLILLDLAMPDMDGLELHRRISVEGGLADVPVVLLSARPDVATTARAIGAADFLCKPMSFDALLRVVRERA